MKALQAQHGGKILPPRIANRWRRNKDKCWVWVPFPDEDRDAYAEGYDTTLMDHPQLGVVNWLDGHKFRFEHMELFNEDITDENGTKEEWDVDLEMLRVCHKFITDQVVPYLSWKGTLEKKKALGSKKRTLEAAGNKSKRRGRPKIG